MNFSLLRLVALASLFSPLGAFRRKLPPPASDNGWAEEAPAKPAKPNKPTKLTPEPGDAFWKATLFAQLASTAALD